METKSSGRLFPAVVIVVVFVVVVVVTVRSIQSSQQRAWSDASHFTSHIVLDCKQDPSCELPPSSPPRVVSAVVL